ncbi:MAG: peptide chain release factor 2 [Thermodesulfobacteriota bacterium]
MVIGNSAEIRQAIRESYGKIEQFRSYLDVPVMKERLAEIEALVAREGFWNTPEKAATLLKERSLLSGRLDLLVELGREAEDVEVLLELAEEETDPETAAEAALRVDLLKKKIEKLSIDLTLSDEDDPADAIVAINAGAGGTDAQDWAEMLFRMYTRWVERKGYKLELIDYQPGDEAGLKSATFSAKGLNAFGYLKNETGVHRLVRISPFNASGKRQTSFASVFVFPQIDRQIEINIDEKDLRIDTFRASGAGGQHVNKTSSAVRITHYPTGVVVQCQQERSQIRNREIAMSVLRARLYQLEKDKQDQKMRDIQEGKDEIAWGNQIRSYFLHPYQKAKDHRTDLEIGDVYGVLDGDIDPFIEAVLMKGR